VRLVRTTKSERNRVKNRLFKRRYQAIITIVHWVYYFGRVIIRVMVFPFAGWEVKGRENVPAEGPVLVVCNHLHLADPPVVAASLPLKCVFMAKEELWQSGWSRFWVENFGAFPVRKGIDTKAIRQAESWLKKGVSVVMFPEGGRSRTGSLQAAYEGAALLALRTGAPVLPVSIAGTDRLNHFIWCLFHRPRITVTFGQPFLPPSNNGKLMREHRNELMNDIMKKIAALLPPEYRGVYDIEKTAGH
jgi:1-acyl-sn-glycerol-3-phosphate acyltransferase